MMVVVAIVAVIMTTIFVGQNAFNNTLILTNTTYDVALSYRSAETYGLGGRTAGTHPTGYGIHVDKSTPNIFTLFADSYPIPSISSVCHPTTDTTALDALPGDCVYEYGQDATVSTYTLGNNITISDFCAKSTSGIWSCANSADHALSTLDVTFARPNPVPFISVNGVYSSAFPYTEACLTVSSVGGNSRYVTITAAGEVTANAPSCP